MKSIYRKTGLIVAVLALLVAISVPTAMAALEQISATWNDPNIEATAGDFPFKDSKYYQFRYYEPGTSYADGDSYHIGTIWLANASSPPHTEYFNVSSSGAENTIGEWTVWLFKAGTSGSTPEPIDSDRVWTTVDVPIPEFATIAIPIVALLGLVAFYRRKQKK
ncbi:MAG: PEF-CTERM sorting domain-containing protein [Euryarchaeota archaeon]|nr:PEF-CTERM sorting domain-containing protein [Euryarchaeota archaeon]